MASARGMRQAPLWEPRAGAGAAAHPGTDDRVLRAFADARSRRSCGAVGDQLVVVLHGLDMFTPVKQVIEVPEIILEDGSRTVLREPLPVEQLVDVSVRLELFWHAAGGGWVAHPMSGGALGVSPPGAAFKRLGAVVRRTAVPHIQEQIVAVEILVGDIPVLVQHKSQQSESYLSVKVPQIQFTIKLLVFRCATETGTHSANCGGIRDSSALLGQGCCRARCALTR